MLELTGANISVTAGPTTFTDSNYGVPATPSTQRVAAMLGIGNAAVSAANPIPVEIYTVGSTPINITAGDINIHTTDLGPNFDSMRIGDGTDTLAINTDGSINTNLSNGTGPIDYNYGVVGAQTLRTASEIGNATGAASFNAGAVGAQTLRVEIADKGVVTLPVSNRESDGTNFLSAIALAAAQLTTGALTAIKATAGVILGWDGATHRELAVDTSGALRIATAAAPVATSATILNGYVVGVLAVTVPSATIFTTDALGATQLSWDNNSGAVIEINAGAGIIATILPGSNGTMPMAIGPALAVTITPQVVGLSATEYVAVRVS
jgi:hypothetical protein